MTDDNLLQEVQEDLDRQKLEALWKRYGGLVMFGAAVIILATAGMTWRNSWREQNNQQATSALAEVMENKNADTAGQIKMLEAFAQKYQGATQAAFARLRAAALAGEAGDKDKAVRLYDGVAGDSSVDTAFRQLAVLMAVQTQMDNGDPSALQKRLWPLEAEKMPWRFTAMEYEAQLALRAGDKAKAKKIFAELSQNASAPKSLNTRAADMLRYLSE